MTMIAPASPLPWDAVAFDSVFPLSGSSSSSGSDPAADALDALSQSYADQVNLLVSQNSTSSPAGTDPLTSLMTSSTSGTDGTSFDEQALLGAMTPASGQVQQLLQQAGLGYSSSGQQLGGAGASQLNLYA